MGWDGFFRQASIAIHGSNRCNPVGLTTFMLHRVAGAVILCAGRIRAWCGVYRILFILQIVTETAGGSGGAVACVTRMLHSHPENTVYNH
jgi:hypothetical protein